MKKYYDDSKIKHIKNKDITIEIKPYRKIINNYIYASKLFNDKYKNKYKIRIFIDFNFLNIFLDNLQDNKGTKVQILNSEINELSPEEILKAYEKLKDSDKE